MRKAVVLLSGGIDSTTTLYLAKNLGYHCFCLIFDYGQRHKKEIKSAQKIVQFTRSSYKIIKFRLPWGKDALTYKKFNLPYRNLNQIAKEIPPTYVPARNTIFLSFALSWAEVLKSEVIYIGANATDYSGYPDCRPDYFKALGKLANLATKAGREGWKIKILTPLTNKTKAEIIKLGQKLKVPYQHTWSCYKGGKKPCLRCDSCLLRAKGFHQANLSDSLI